MLTTVAKSKEECKENKDIFNIFNWVNTLKRFYIRAIKQIHFNGQNYGSLYDQKFIIMR